MYTKVVIQFDLEVRTGMHIGGSSSFSAIGAVDSPVIRDPLTGRPIVPGSSLKGVLADLWNDENFKRTSDGEELFGKTDSKDAKAGQLLVGESRVLAFPVRSAMAEISFFKQEN